MDKTQLQLLLLGVGVVLIALIYLWGKRAERKQRLREQRHRVTERSPEQEPMLSVDPAYAAEVDTAERKLDDEDIQPAQQPEVVQDRADVEVMPVRDYEADLQAHEHAPQAAHAEPPPKKVSPPPSPPQQNSAPDTSPSPANPTLTVLLTVVPAPGQLFHGPSILLAIQEQRLRLHNGVFEQMCSDHEREQALFGVAHLREPGTFELHSIGNLTTPGLLMFMQLPGPLEPTSAIDRMVTTAKQLAHKLGGIVCDERRNKLTPQGLGKLHNDAAELERKLRLKRA